MPRSIPSLRELLQHIIERQSLSHSLYILLEALVEIVEPEKHTCGECGFFREHSGCPDVDDREWASRFCYTDPESPACWNFVPSVKCDRDHPCGESKEQYMRSCFTKTLSELRKEQKQSA